MTRILLQFEFAVRLCVCLFGIYSLNFQWIWTKLHTDFLLGRLWVDRQILTKIALILLWLIISLCMSHQSQGGNPIGKVLIRIGPDRAYPLHFTRPQLLLLPVLLPVLLHFRNEIGMESVSFSFLGPILWNDDISAFNFQLEFTCHNRYDVEKHVENYTFQHISPHNLNSLWSAKFAPTLPLDNLDRTDWHKYHISSTTGACRVIIHFSLDSYVCTQININQLFERLCSMP